MLNARLFGECAVRAALVHPSGNSFIVGSLFFNSVVIEHIGFSSVVFLDTTQEIVELS